jgi:hypothetical protein
LTQKSCTILHSRVLAHRQGCAQGPIDSIRVRSMSEIKTARPPIRLKRTATPPRLTGTLFPTRVLTPVHCPSFFLALKRRLAESSLSVRDECLLSCHCQSKFDISTVHEQCRNSYYCQALGTMLLLILQLIDTVKIPLIRIPSDLRQLQFIRELECAGCHRRGATI